MERLDAALYEFKRSGKGRAVLAGAPALPASRSAEDRRPLPR